MKVQLAPDIGSKQVFTVYGHRNPGKHDCAECPADVVISTTRLQEMKQPTSNEGHAFNVTRAHALFVPAASGILS